MSGTAINYTAVVFYGLVVGAIALIVLYFLKINPFYSTLTGAATWLNVNLLSKLGGSNIGQIINDNKAALIGIGVTTIPLVYATIRSQMQKAAADKAAATAKELLTIEKSTAATTIEQAKTSAQTEIQALQEKLKQYENDPALDTLQTNYSSAKTQIQNLTAQNQDLSTKYNTYLQNIWTTQGSKIVTDPNGETYKLVQIIQKVVT